MYSITSSSLLPFPCVVRVPLTWLPVGVLFLLSGIDISCRVCPASLSGSLYNHVYNPLF